MPKRRNIDGFVHLELWGVKHLTSWAGARRKEICICSEHDWCVYLHFVERTYGSETYAQRSSPPFERWGMAALSPMTTIIDGVGRSCIESAVRVALHLCTESTVPAVGEERVNREMDSQTQYPNTPFPKSTQQQCNNLTSRTSPALLNLLKSYKRDKGSIIVGVISKCRKE